VDGVVLGNKRDKGSYIINKKEYYVCFGEGRKEWVSDKGGSTIYVVEGVE
jgi:hypothetical protein